MSYLNETDSFDERQALILFPHVHHPHCFVVVPVLHVTLAAVSFVLETTTTMMMMTLVVVVVVAVQSPFSMVRLWPPGVVHARPASVVPCCVQAQVVVQAFPIHSSSHELFFFLER